MTKCHKCVWDYHRIKIGCFKLDGFVPSMSSWVFVKILELCCLAKKLKVAKATKYLAHKMEVKHTIGSCGLILTPSSIIQDHEWNVLVGDMKTFLSHFGMFPSRTIFMSC